MKKDKNCPYLTESMNDNPLISIITVVRNGVFTIEQTILSVLNQTYGKIEYIIVDGASTDGTLGIIMNYELRIKNREFPNVSFHYISEPDKGIYDAMNKGIDKATGQWINFMNSGDCFAKNDTLFSIFINKYDTSVGVIYGDWTNVKDDGSSTYEKPYPFFYSKRFSPPQGMCHQSMFVLTSLVKEIKFDTKFLISADYDMIHKIYRKGANFTYVNMLVANFKMGGISTGKKYKLVYDEDAKVVGVFNTKKFKIIRLGTFMKINLKMILFIFFRYFLKMQKIDR
jgi:glycosyltransferase involved in cell wall biosynthesis